MFSLLLWLKVITLIGVFIHIRFYVVRNDNEQLVQYFILMGWRQFKLHVPVYSQKSI